MKFLAAKCPSCMGELQIPDDKDFVQCSYCGVDVKVREAIKLRLDINIPNLLNLAKYSFEAKNYQEAINYYNKVLEAEINNFGAWFGKAEASGMSLINLKGLNSSEMVICFNNSVKYYSGDNLTDYKKKVALKIYDICNKYLEKVFSYRNNIPNNPKVWDEFISHCKFIIEILEKGLEYDLDNVKIPEGIILICRDNINMDGIYPSGTGNMSSFDSNSKLWLSPEYKNSLLEKINVYTQRLPAGHRTTIKVNVPAGIRTGKLSTKSKIILAIAVLIFLIFLLLTVLKSPKNKTIQQNKKTGYNEKIYFNNSTIINSC